MDTATPLPHDAAKHFHASFPDTGLVVGNEPGDGRGMIYRKLHRVRQEVRDWDGTESTIAVYSDLHAIYHGVSIKATGRRMRYQWSDPLNREALTVRVKFENDHESEWVKGEVLFPWGTDIETARTQLNSYQEVE